MKLLFSENIFFLRKNSKNEIFQIYTKRINFFKKNNEKKIYNIIIYANI